MPGAALLAQIIGDKFVLHLPFYRQARRYEQLGMHIPASTINTWVESGCCLIEIVGEEQRRRVLSSTYLLVDETPIRVLDKQKKGKSHRGYYWVYYSPEQKLVWFDYQPGRGREGPAKRLKDFQGYLQTDGYTLYEKFGQQPGITLVGCMAHARRKFEHALANDKSRAEKVLLWMQELYALEREAREKVMTSQQRYELRQEKAGPIITELKEWLIEEYPKLLPKSSIGKAFHYLLSRLEPIARYLEDGRLEIDTNLVENTIRPVAIGRKNYLFAGSHNGARRAALIYSLLISCKLQGLNPYEYLQDVLERLPLHPVNQLADLLPSNWKPTCKTANL
jgi:hypothetical protein